MPTLPYPLSLIAITSAGVLELEIITYSTYYTNLS
jgi:hypothetical protein